MPAAAGAADGGSPQSLHQVMAELSELGELDRQAQAQLMQDLQKTDPALWPLVVQHFRAAIEYRQQTRQGTPEKHESLAPRVARPPAHGGAAQPPASQQASHEAPPQPGGPPADPRPPNATPQKLQTGPSGSAMPPSHAALAAKPPAAAGQAEVPGEGRTVVRASFDRSGGSPASSATGDRPGAARRAGSVRGDWRSALDTTIQSLEQQIPQSPSTAVEVADHARLRMLYVIAGQRDEALRPIPSLDPSLQDFWTKELYGLSACLDTERFPEPSQRAAETKRHLLEAAAALGATAPLSVRSLAFCNEIQSYGSIHRFEKYEFMPGQRVLLYAEVDNFSSDPTAKGYHTELRSSYEIFDMQGRRVAEPKSTVIEEYCASPRHDFFIAHDFQMPRQIYPGNYTLQLTIEDLKSKKVGQSAIDFSIRAPR
jgi:hypothetical protein